MKVIQPNCRVQFTAEDIAFIATVLGKNPDDTSWLTNLLTDSETRDLILDDEKLFHALLEYRGCLRVSEHFYFYVLVRQVLRRAGIDSRAVSDYVAELLAEFSHQERTRCVLPGPPPKPLDYVFEMLAALQTADDRTSFYLQAHIGNHSLFFTGVFASRIRYRHERRAFPNLRYYEELGRMNYRAASNHRLAQKYDLGPIYETLSERFHPARVALNDLAERIFSIGDPDVDLRKLFHPAGE